MIGVEERDTTLNFDMIQDGDILKMMIIGFDFPKFYLDGLKEADFVRQEQSKAMGIDFLPTMPSHKEGGLMMKCAVIERNGKSTIKVEDGKVILPKYFISCNINQLTLPQVAEKNSKMFENGKYFGFFEQQKGMSSKYGKNKSVSIINIHPESGVAQDFNSKVWANAVPLGFEDAYVDLVEKERTRKDRWEHSLDQWKNLTEQQAIDELMESLSRRFLLAYRGEKNFHFVEPCVGMIFGTTAKASGGKYWRTHSFQWNKKDSLWDTHNLVPYEPPVVTEKMVDIAGMITTAMEIDIEERRKAKEAKASEVVYDATQEAIDMAIESGDDANELPWM